MRRMWVGTGWKMNKTRAEAEVYARELGAFAREARLAFIVFVVPPYTALCQVSDLLAGSPVLVGAQNMHWAERGACTGEISPLQVRDCGAHLVELGHSERRASWGETDYTVNLKVLSALRHSLTPLVCVGENAQEKEFGAAREFVARQVKIALHGVTPDDARRVVFAYEPVWAIGEGGTPATPDYANAMHGHMRSALSDLYGPTVADEIPILYGGSVNHDNALALVVQPQVDGLFVGRAAWQAGGFINLLQAVSETIRIEA